MKRLKRPFGRDDKNARFDRVLDFLFLIASVAGAVVFPAPFRWAFVALGCFELLRLLRKSD